MTQLYSQADAACARRMRGSNSFVVAGERPAMQGQPQRARVTFRIVAKLGLPSGESAV